MRTEGCYHNKSGHVSHAIACGTAANTLEALKWVIQDIELVAEQDAGIKVLASIKNTMSDCAGKFWRIISLTYFQQLLKTG